MLGSAALKANTCEQYIGGHNVEALTMTAHGTALVLEDDEFDAAVTQELLERCCERKFTVTRVRVLKDAVSMLSRAEYDVVLLDMNVPDSSGLDTVREAIKANPRAPLIVLTGNEDISVAIEALRLGAQDYLPKSQLDNQTLQRIIQYAIRRKELETDLTTKAYFDSLTGLANRALLYERWRRSLARSKRAGCMTGVLIADIDRFKLINDRYSHDAGDSLLRHFAGKLARSVRETDIVARLGGDEFVIVLENIDSKDEIESVRNTLSSTLSDSFDYEGKKLSYSVSIGGTLTDPRDEEDLMAALKRADAEMYEFKALAHKADGHGKSTIVQ